MSTESGVDSQGEPMMPDSSRRVFLRLPDLLEAAAHLPMHSRSVCWLVMRCRRSPSTWKIAANIATLMTGLLLTPASQHAPTQRKDLLTQWRSALGAVNALLTLLEADK